MPNGQDGKAGMTPSRQGGRERYVMPNVDGAGVMLSVQPSDMKMVNGSDNAFVEARSLAECKQRP